MEEIRRTEVGDRPADRMMAVAEQLVPEMAFLAENPEAFGLVPDACPLATGHLLIAANGHSAEGGTFSPVYEMGRPGVEGLFDLYGSILARTAETEDALHFVFGENRNMREHPVSRYCAALAEVVALRVMNGPANGASYEQTLLMLNDELRRALRALRARFAELDQVENVREDFFEPSIGLCRIREQGGGDYTVDVFSAGDFHIYILDEWGMAPLWSAETPAFSLDGQEGLTGKSLQFRHPAPFAVLLLSESICALNAAEYRSLRSNPGLIWKYRMRLEDYFLRLITDCVRDFEFGDRATRFFVGRSHGHDSASGAMAVLRRGVSYETFRLHCQNRLSSLEKQIGLLANGYDPHNIPARATRAATEVQYIRRLLDQSPELTDRIANALRLCVLRKFEQGDEAPAVALPEEIPEYKRLDLREIRQAFDRLDCENHADRARIAENDRILRESLAEHWITLRPVLMETVGEAAPEGGGYREVSEEIYRVCLDMNRRLAEMQEARRTALDRIKTLMLESLDAADAEGNDWVCGRAGTDSVSAWMAPLQHDLPDLLASMKVDWQEGTERYRSLLAAYTAEREALFSRDVKPADGGFAADWQAVLEGRLPEERWEDWIARLTRRPETADFGEFMDALRRVSRGTGALMARIRARAAENRMVRELSNRTDLRIAALRGAAYEDPDWGEEIISVMDTATRNDFRATVRRWQEACRLMEQQKQAYEAYAAMYGTYEK